MTRYSITAAGLLLACASRSGGRPDWDGFVNDFLQGYFKADPSFAVYQGRHEFDGRLPDWSDEAIRQRITQLHRRRDAAVAFDTAAFDARQRFERHYLIAQIDKDLFWLETAQQPWRNPVFYAEALDPNVYVTRPYAPLPERLRSLTLWAQALPPALRQIRANLRTPMPRSYVQIGRIRFGGLIEYLEHDVPQAFAPVADANLQREFRRASAEAVRGLHEMDDWLAAELPRATANFALGPELFGQMLRETEGVEIPLERLEAMGRADLKRNQDALREACGQFAPRQSISRCIDRVNAVKPVGGPVQAARRQLPMLREFIRTHDLVTVPGTEEAAVEESPPYQRWNAAYIDIPGPYEKGLASVYYIAPPDTHWTELEKLAYLPGEPTLLFTSVHEVWPGHFLQFLHSNRSQSELGRVFVGYAFAEGWAHYAEEMMWEAGLGGGDPELHIGQLLEALLRDVRFLSAIGLHTRGMTVEESERMFREEAYQDPANARQQAARGTFDPAYLNYTLGKLMILQLREDWTRDKGGRAAWKQFHDTFLAFGGPPIPLVRRAMMGAQQAEVSGVRARAVTGAR